MNPDEMRLAFARNLLSHNETTKSFTLVDMAAFAAKALSAMPATFTAAEKALAQTGSWTPAMAAKAKTAGHFEAPKTTPDTDLLFWITGRPK